MRRCASCKETKSANKFYKDKDHKDGLSTYCRVCQIRIVSERRRLNPQKARIGERKKWLRVHYNLTLEGYDKLLKEQNGVCVICGKFEKVKTNTGTVKHLSVDHDHETGKVRGLLCNKCNTRVGILENKNWRPLAEKYLKSSLKNK